MTVVIKVGGDHASDPQNVVEDIPNLREAGHDVVFVHGGSTMIDETLERIGIEPEYVETPDGVIGRFTDEATMEAVTMALSLLNTTLVTALANEGVNAVGLSGVDGHLLAGPRTGTLRVMEGDRKRIRRGDHSGRIEAVNEGILEQLLADDYVPVVTLPMLAADGDLLVPVNADADRAGSAIAAALEGEYVVLTDVPGVLEDIDDPSSVIGRVDTPERLDQTKSAAEGFMTRKVMAAENSLKGGAQSVTIADATVENPVTRALDGAGTVLTPGAIEGEQTTGGMAQ